MQRAMLQTQAAALWPLNLSTVLGNATGLCTTGDSAPFNFVLEGMLSRKSGDTAPSYQDQLHLKHAHSVVQLPLLYLTLKFTFWSGMYQYKQSDHQVCQCCYGCCCCMPNSLYNDAYSVHR